MMTTDPHLRTTSVYTLLIDVSDSITRRDAQTVVTNMLARYTGGALAGSGVTMSHRAYIRFRAAGDAEAIAAATPICDEIGTVTPYIAAELTTGTGAHLRTVAIA